MLGKRKHLLCLQYIECCSNGNSAFCICMRSLETICPAWLIKSYVHTLAQRQKQQQWYQEQKQNQSTKQSGQVTFRGRKLHKATKSSYVSIYLLPKVACFVNSLINLLEWFTENFWTGSNILKMSYNTAFLSCCKTRKKIHLSFSANQFFNVQDSIPIIRAPHIGILIKSIKWRR